MNERIRELIKEMGIIPEDEHYEVAELIVRECMLVVDACESDLFYDNGMVPIIDVNDRIKEHFGVE